MSDSGSDNESFEQTTKSFIAPKIHEQPKNPPALKRNKKIVQKVIKKILDEDPELSPEEVVKYTDPKKALNEERQRMVYEKRLANLEKARLVRQQKKEERLKQKEEQKELKSKKKEFEIEAEIRKELVKRKEEIKAKKLEQEKIKQENRAKRFKAKQEEDLEDEEEEILYSAKPKKAPARPATASTPKTVHLTPQQIMKAMGY